MFLFDLYKRNENKMYINFDYEGMTNKMTNCVILTGTMYMFTFSCFPVNASSIH